MSAVAKAQAALKQPQLTERDLADGQREHELLEGGARWLCLMLKLQKVAPQLFPTKKPGEKKERRRERPLNRGLGAQERAHEAGAQAAGAWSPGAGSGV